MTSIRRVSLICLLIFSYCLCRVNAQIAPGVTQSAAQTATITGTVTGSSGNPLSKADVRLSGGSTRLETITDSYGNFHFVSVPYGTYRIEVSVADLGVAERESVIVRGDITLAIQYVQPSTGGIKEIARVSTRSAGLQINVTAASIASVSPSAYAFEGNASWKQLLNRIPGVVVGGYLNGGSSTTNSIPGSPLQPTVLSINGALPYETSVTLDGMPLQSRTTSTSSMIGGGYDLGAVPMTVFETGDVVRGPGADAPSILDSIGGSFVLHGPGVIEHNQIIFSAANDAYGGIITNFKAAAHIGKLSAVVAYGVNNSPGPHGNSYSGPIFESFLPATIGGQPFNGCSSGSGPASACFQYLLCPNYQPTICGQNNELLLSGASYSSAWRQHDGAIGLSYELSPSANAQIFYAENSYTMNDPLPATSATFIPGSGYSGGLSPGLHVVPGFQPFIFSQASTLLEEKFTSSLGRGVLRLAAVQNNSWASSWNFAGTALPNGQYTLNGTGFFTGQIAPHNFNNETDYVTFGQCVANEVFFMNNRDLLASYGTQIGQKVRAGISYVTSYYNAPESLVFKLSSVQESINQSDANSLTTRELRLSLGADVTNRFSLDASWYVARGVYHVEDPAAVTIINNSVPVRGPWNEAAFPYSAPRLGMTWRGSENFVVRGSVGGGYALPPINDLIGSLPLPVCNVFNTCTVNTVNLQLKPETSFGFDVGADLRIHRDTVVSLDLYRINLFGQFFSTTNASSYSGPNCATPPCTLYTTQFNNLQQTRFEGINVDVRHDVPQGIYWRGQIGLIRSYVVSLPPGFYNSGSSTCNFSTGAGCTSTYIVPGINFNGVNASSIAPIPYANGGLAVGYRWSPQKYFELVPTYYGNGNPYFEPAFMEFDANASYPLTKNISLLGAFRNITNIYGQGLETNGPPSLGAPTVASAAPYPLVGIPYGPRSFILTLRISY